MKNYSQTNFTDTLLLTDCVLSWMEEEKENGLFLVIHVLTCSFLLNPKLGDWEWVLPITPNNEKKHTYTHVHKVKSFSYFINKCDKMTQNNIYNNENIQTLFFELQYAITTPSYEYSPVTHNYHLSMLER